MHKNSYFVEEGAQLRTQGLKTVSYIESALYFSLMAIGGHSIISTGTVQNQTLTTVSHAFIYSC